MALYRVFQAGSVFLEVVQLGILIYTVLSWFRPRTVVYRWLEAFIAPFVAPFRRLSSWVVKRLRLPVDLSCWFAVVGLGIAERLWMLLYRLLRLL